MSERMTCPECSREMYVVCGNKECVCWKSIPDGRRPLKNKMVGPFGVELSQKWGQRIWNVLRWGPILWLIGHPGRLLLEIEECPYCGFAEPIGYWFEREVDWAREQGLMP